MGAFPSLKEVMDQPVKKGVEILVCEQSTRLLEMSRGRVYFTTLGPRANDRSSWIRLSFPMIAEYDLRFPIVSQINETSLRSRSPFAVPDKTKIMQENSNTRASEGKTP